MSSKSKHVKVFFEIVDEDDPTDVEIESMWAVPTAGGYKVDNIPFHAYGVALSDGC